MNYVAGAVTIKQNCHTKLQRQPVTIYYGNGCERNGSKAIGHRCPLIKDVKSIALIAQT